MEQPTQKQIIERQTAKIVSIKEIVKGKYVKQEGMEPNYVISQKNEHLMRVNILGIIVSIPQTSNAMYIEDGTEKIELRVFENPSLLSNFTIGDIALVIGKPREYNQTIYIAVENIHKIMNKGWLEYRKKEIALHNIQIPDVVIQKKDKEPEIIHSETNKSDDNLSEQEIIIENIRRLDEGKGCDINQLIDLNPRAEELIQLLISKGDVYEFSPGKVKVLD